MGEALKNQFSWSRSRAATFAECPRRYWYHYYGSWGGWEESAPARARELYVLKHLETRWMWAGSIVHDTVERVLTWARTGHPLSEDAAAAKAVERMRGEWTQSRDGLWRSRPKRARGLVEHAFNLPVSDDDWRGVADHVRSCIGHFYASPYFAFLPKLPRENWLPIEERAMFTIGDVTVYVKPDAAFRTGGAAIELVDWKTSRREDEPDAVQLACYSLFALEQKWAPRPEDVTTTEYNLARGQARESRVTPKRLEQASAAIRESAAAMRARLDDVEANEGREDNFPMTAETMPCRTCNFRTACPQGRSLGAPTPDAASLFG